LNRGSVLRILDSKEPEDQAIINECPKIHQFLSEESKEHWEFIINALNDIGISYVHNPNLVRGLDYYDHTCFEFTVPSETSRIAILGGGRYNNLVSQLSEGKQQCGAVGWSAGVERLIDLLPDSNKEWDTTPTQVAVVPIHESQSMNPAVTKMVIAITTFLRHNGISCFIIQDPKGTLGVGKLMRMASSRQCPFTILIGDTELNSRSVVIKDLKTRTQTSVPIDNAKNTFPSILQHLRGSLQKNKS